MITTRHTRGLTVNQVATVCGVDPNTVRNWIFRKRITRNRWGRIEPEDLAKYLVERGDVGQRKHARQHGFPMSSCPRTT